MGEYYVVLNSLNNLKETYPTKSQQEENKTYKKNLKRGKTRLLWQQRQSEKMQKTSSLDKKILQIESNEAENYKKGPKCAALLISYITSDSLSLSADASE